MENIYQIAGLVIFISAIFYFFYFRKIKKERKLIQVERLVYIITQIVIFLWALSFILFIIDKI